MLVINKPKLEPFMKATNHPKIVIDVDRDFKQQLLDICQIKGNISIKEYVLDSLIEKMQEDSEILKDKLDILRSLRIT